MVAVGLNSRVSLDAHAVAEVAPCLALTTAEVRVLPDLQAPKHARGDGG